MGRSLKELFYTSKRPPKEHHLMEIIGLSTGSRNKVRKGVLKYSMSSEVEVLYVNGCCVIYFNHRIKHFKQLRSVR